MYIAPLHETSHFINCALFKKSQFYKMGVKCMVHKRSLNGLCICQFVCFICVHASGPSRAKPSKTFPVDTQIYEIHQPPAQIHVVGATKNRLKGYFYEYDILGLENLTRVIHDMCNIYVQSHCPKVTSFPRNLENGLLSFGYGILDFQNQIGGSS